MEIETGHSPLIVRGDVNWHSRDMVEVRNPWDEAVVAKVPHIDPNELRNALDWAAPLAVSCKSWPVEDRIGVMLEWAKLFLEHKREIAELETREMGKPISQSMAVIDGVISRLESFCNACKELGGDRYATNFAKRSERVHAFSVREPFGLVAGILPFNSPVSALVWKVAPALLMGNAVVIKVSELAPLAALRAVQLLATLSLPQGALQAVNGIGAALGPVISEHFAVRRICFAGGSPTGVDIFKRSADTMKRLTLECGSNDAALVLPDADLAVTSKTIVNSGIRLYNGQICSAPKRCIVASEILDEFTEVLLEETDRVVQGNPLEATTELGPLVNRAAAERVELQVQEAVAADARLVCGGKRKTSTFFPPTIISNVGPENPIFRESAFGPVLALTAASDVDEAVNLANDSRFALRATVFGRDLQRATQVANRLDCGGVAINGTACLGDPYLTVEPRKMSGIGGEGIYLSLFEHSQSKFIYVYDWWSSS